MAGQFGHNAYGGFDHHPNNHYMAAAGLGLTAAANGVSYLSDVVANTARQHYSTYRDWMINNRQRAEDAYAVGWRDQANTNLAKSYLYAGGKALVLYKGAQYARAANNREAAKLVKEEQKLDGLKNNRMVYKRRLQIKYTRGYIGPKTARWLRAYNRRVKRRRRDRKNYDY